MHLFKKNPKIHKVIRVWTEQGRDYWLMPYDDFNSLYENERVVSINGIVCASITFAATPIIVQRQEKVK